MARKTKEEALATRAQLLDAAERVFSERGVGGTSLGEIAQAAGVTRGAIYWHFKNKYALIEALLERIRLPLDEVIAAKEAEYAGDPLGQIRASVVTVLQRVVTDPHLHAVCSILLHKCEYTDAALPVLERKRANRAECAVDIEAKFRAAMAAGQLRAGIDPRLATLGLFSYVDGLIYNWLLDPGYFSLQEEAAGLVEIYLAGLQP